MNDRTDQVFIKRILPQIIAALRKSTEFEDMIWYYLERELTPKKLLDIEKRIKYVKEKIEKDNKDVKSREEIQAERLSEREQGIREIKEKIINYLKKGGATTAGIAEELGVTRQTLSTKARSGVAFKELKEEKMIIGSEKFKERVRIVTWSLNK